MEPGGRTTASSGPGTGTISRTSSAPADDDRAGSAVTAAPPPRSSRQLLGGGDPATASVYQSLGTINVNLEPSPNDTGLFNILRYEFYKVGIDYDPNTYPYFFKKVLPYSLANHTNANGFKNWTAAQFTAAFNLGQIYKTGNAAYVHNYYYTAQILIDSLRSIGVTTNPKTGNPFVRPTSPTGGTTHQATDYRTIVIP